MTKKKHDDDPGVSLGAMTFLGRMRTERDIVTDWLEKLSAFIDSANFSSIDQEERERLLAQKTAMGHYVGILNARIAYHEARGGE